MKAVQDINVVDLVVLNQHETSVKNILIIFTVRWTEYTTFLGMAMRKCCYCRISVRWIGFISFPVRELQILIQLNCKFS